MSVRRNILVIALTVSWVAGCATSGGMQAADSKADRPLKYRDGPVCMCSGGLSESDIEDAQRQRNQSDLPEAD
jgi:hypothetical protein